MVIVKYPGVQNLNAIRVFSSRFMFPISSWLFRGQNVSRHVWSLSIVQLVLMKPVIIDVHPKVCLLPKHKDLSSPTSKCLT